MLLYILDHRRSDALRSVVLWIRLALAVWC